MMGSRRKHKFSRRVIRWSVREILRRGGESTTSEIKAELAAKYRNCPTSQQLGQILKRSGFFIQLGTTSSKTITGTGEVFIWGVNEERCNDEFEWFEAEVAAVKVWAEARGDGGSPKGGWDAPSRIGNKKGKPKKSKSSDTETENNSVE